MRQPRRCLLLRHKWMRWPEASHSLRDAAFTALDRRRAAGAPDRLVYLLDHQYTQRGLAWTRLKNADAARAATLREVAQRLDCEIFLALADVHESWSCDDEEGLYGTGAAVSGLRNTTTKRKTATWKTMKAARHRPSASSSRLTSSSAIGSRWTVGWTPCRARLISTKCAIREPRMILEPFASEHEGYMGNYGNTVDRWYHRAAVVLWPRERTFVIRAKSSPRSAIDELTKTLRRGDVQGAREMVQRLAPFWKRVANREENRRFLERTLVVAGGLDNPELAAALLQPFSLERLTPKAAPKLVALSQRYGSMVPGHARKRGQPMDVATTRWGGITRRGRRRSPASASSCMRMAPSRDAIWRGGWSRRSGRRSVRSGSSFASTPSYGHARCGV